jgi:hypothetical protein
MLVALVCACAWLAGAHASAQAQQGALQVSARLSTGVAKLGSSVRLLIEVVGARTATLDALPEIDGLRAGKPSGPSLSESYEIFGRRQTVSRKLTWEIQLQPLRAGEFSVPSVRVQADGQTLQTRELALKVVEDLKGDELGFFEMDVPDQVVEGQPFTLEMRFGWDAALDRELNYANLTLPWMSALPGIIELEGTNTASNASFVELALNSRDRIRAEQLPQQTVNGRPFRMLRVRKRYLATRPGKLEFPISHFEFGQVSEGGIFATRPAERRTYFKSFPGFEIEVQKLPEQGQPLDYTGAVGTIQATASADRRDVDVGDSIKLTVEWTGAGNLEYFDPPDPARMEEFKDFRVYGTTDRKSYERRVVVYDIAPIASTVRAIPPLPLRVYDPVRKQYVTVATNPIAISVRPLKAGSTLANEQGPTAFEFDIRDIQTRSHRLRELARPRSYSVLAALAVVLAGWITLRTIVRRRGDPDAPRQRARRRARRELARALARAAREGAGASAQARAFQHFLAQRTGEGEQAWVGRDVRAWARAHAEEWPLSAEHAGELERLLQQFDERTWSTGGAAAGSDQALDARDVLDTADKLVRGGL